MEIELPANKYWSWLSDLQWFVIFRFFFVFVFFSQHAHVDFPVNSPKFQQELVYKLVPTGTGHLEFPAQEIIL